MSDPGIMQQIGFNLHPFHCSSVCKLCWL